MQSIVLGCVCEGAVKGDKHLSQYTGRGRPTLSPGGHHQLPAQVEYSKQKMQRADWLSLLAFLFLPCWRLPALEHQTPSSSVLSRSLALLAPQACQQPIVGPCDLVS